jgi:hypothetical protein
MISACDFSTDCAAASIPCSLKSAASQPQTGHLGTGISLSLEVGRSAKLNTKPRQICGRCSVKEGGRLYLHPTALASQMNFALRCNLLRNWPLNSHANTTSRRQPARPWMQLENSTAPSAVLVVATTDRFQADVRWIGLGAHPVTYLPSKGRRSAA